MFFVIPEMPSKTFVMLYKKNFLITLSKCAPYSIIIGQYCCSQYRSVLHGSQLVPLGGATVGTGTLHNGFNYVEFECTHGCMYEGQDENEKGGKKILTDFTILYISQRTLPVYQIPSPKVNLKQFFFKFNKRGRENNYFMQSARMLFNFFSSIHQ